MRIVIVGPAYPLRGGIAQYLAVLYQKLTDAGHEAKFVSFIKQFPKLLFPGKTQLDDSRDVINVHPAAKFAPLGPVSWLRTAREVASFNPDLVIFKWWMPFFGLGYWAVQRWVRKHTKARVLYIIDNVIPHEHRPGDKFLTRLAFSQTDFFVSQSQAVERDLFTWFPDLDRKRTAFSPHPVYDCYPVFPGTQAEARAAAGLSREGRWLLFFGFVRRYKGLDILINALPAIHKKFSDVKLAVVGEFYGPREEYDKIIRDLGLTNAVSVRADYCPNEEVGKYFAACDAVVLPYRTATQSGIIQVAYALDLPVITTNVGGLSEVVMDGVTGMVVPPENPAAIAAAVVKFYEQGGRNAFIENVRKESRRYSWDAMMETILNLAKRP
ncbi:glycosyltransferase [candidate division KSB1 bacterium]|nr:MAG: glycosyltransferase [candidate division KSB1 bacterium]